MESQSEINRKARDLKNTQQLQLCYNAIVRADVFEYIQEPDEISGCNYIRMLNDWKKNRNETVFNNQLLNSVKGWLIPFNNRMTDLMFWYVSSFNKIIKWKNKKEDVSFNGFEIQLDKRLEFFNQIPTCIRLNYDKDKYLAFEIQEYCLNGFKQMITYTKDELMIDIEKTPFFAQIQNVINQIQDEIDLEKLSLSLNHKPKENQSKVSSTNPFSDIFKGEDDTNFSIFKTFTEKHIIDWYADYSFIFQKMKSENRLQNIKQLYFMEWLKTNNYISEKVYDDFLSKGTFSKKYNSAQRENNYNNVVNDMLQ